VNRGYERGAREQTLIVSTAGDAEPVEITCTDDAGVDCADDWTWSPDDTKIIGRTPSGAYVLVDAATGQATATGWYGIGLPSWQRTGP
jgi:hypothetical protein